MLRSLGLVGTIAEGDVGPVDPESGSSEDEEVGPGGICCLGRGWAGPGRTGAGAEPSWSGPGPARVALSRVGLRWAGAEVGAVRFDRPVVVAYWCYYRSCAGRRAPDGGAPQAGTSVPLSSSARQRPAGKAPGRRHCASSAAR